MIVTKEERNRMIEEYIGEIMRIARFENKSYFSPWFLDEEDFFQEGIARLLKDAELWDEKKSGFRTFVHSRTRFGIKDATRVRANTAKVSSCTDFIEDVEEATFQEVGYTQSADLVVKMEYEYVMGKLEFLPPLEREVIIANFSEGKTLAEIGASHGYSEAWASLLRGRAIERIQKMIEADNESRCRNKDTSID